jgi:hypothetical protein
MLRCGWLVLVAVLASGGYRMWNRHQEKQRLEQARQKAEALFEALVPRAEARLEQGTRQLRELRKSLELSSAAERSELIEPARHRVQQKRLQMQADEVERLLDRLAGSGPGAPPQAGVAAGPQVLARDQTERLAAMFTQLEQFREEIEALRPEMDLAKARRTQLVAAETEASLRAQANAEALARAEMESRQLAGSEAIPPRQAESGPPTQPETVPWAPWEASPAPHVSFAPGGFRYVLAAPVLRVNRPLIIGSGYPDRFVGYRNGPRFGPYPVVLLPPPPPFWYW